MNWSHGVERFALSECILFTHVMKSRHLILVKFFFGQQKFKCCVLIFYFFLAKPLRDSLKSLKKYLKKKNYKKKNIVSGIEPQTWNYKFFTLHS